MVIHERPAVDRTAEPLSLDEARAALAADWAARNPQTPDEIAAFYRETDLMAVDLDAWHRTEDRRSWSAMLVHVARESGARCIVDIGCGPGYDLAALRAALPDATLVGVEPNAAMLARATNAAGLNHGYPDKAMAPIEDADLLVCCDVLEHVPDPEAFLGAIAARAKLGAYLFETTGTEDCTTPLHLACNRGWHPGRVLEQHGFALQDTADRVRVWQRVAAAGAQRAGLLLCAYRGVTSESLNSIMTLTHSGGGSWRLRTKVGDSWIGRSRSIAVTKWWAETNDDVFLMVDDDVAFGAADADRIVELARALDIVCGAYPVHNGAHLSLKCFAGTDEIQFGPGQPPLEIRYAATGFMAVSRRVIDALIAGLPLVSSRQPWAYYPLFPTPLVTDEETGEVEHLSEDWGFCQIAREAGFRIWLDPQTRLSHGSHVPVTVSNMGAMHEALKRA